MLLYLASLDGGALNPAVVNRMLSKARGFYRVVPGEIFWRRPAAETPERDVIYFIQEGGDQGLIKIGFTKSLPRRLSELACESRLGIRLLGSVDVGEHTEGSLQREFAEDRERGEWFRPSDRLLARIAELADRTS